MSDSSQRTRELINKYQSLEVKEGITTIHVDEVASKVASFYEKVRGIIDWKESHLLKRSVIERILGRRIVTQLKLGSKGPRLESNVEAEPFVLELIRSGHFPNNQIEESKIGEIQEIVDRYTYIINQAPDIEEGTLIKFVQWVISIAACEIEETLMPYIKERALMDFMYSKLEETTILSDSLKKNIDDEERKIQIFINVRKALFDLDDAIITYHLIRYKYPSWTELTQEDERLLSVATNIHSIRKEMEDHLENPLGGKILQLCQKYNTPFFIIGDIINESPSSASENIFNPETFENLISEKYDIRTKNLKSKLRRAAFYSTFSIFLTNIVSLFAVEIPLTKILGEFSLLACVLDIIVPTLIMAFLVLTIPPPPKGNKEVVIMETIKIAYGSKQKEFHEIKEFRKKGGLFSFIISLLYGLGFLTSIGFMVWALNKINFPPFSHVIFVVFLSMIAFAGTKIREKSRELHMVEVKEGFLATIVDLFALPIIFFGKWLTVRWKKYNVVSVFFNALIDMPFSAIVEFLEQWRFFLKEKRENI